MLTFARDPFARLSRTRELEYVHSAGCAYCGAHKYTKTGLKFLYRYGITPDSGRDSQDSKLFCSVGCRDSYYS